MSRNSHSSLHLGNRIHGPGGSAALGDWLKGVRTKIGERTQDEVLALLGNSQEEMLAAAAWLWESEVDGIVLPVERISPEVKQRLLERGYRLLNLDQCSDDAPVRRMPARRGRISMLTSGTTGEPKIVEHTRESLFTMGRVKSSHAANWLLTYQTGTYAWWQMATLHFCVAEQALTVSHERAPVALAEAAARCGVTSISATPTFWRMVMLQMPPQEIRRIPLRQITMGGEAVDQGILDRLHELFPQATLTHIYASTEAGAAIVVRDGKEGFPADWLCVDRNDSAVESPRLQIRDGILWVRSPYAAHADWVNTGDLCEVRGSRVIILGREQNAFINVGGVKVPGHEVERVLRTHPAVLWCRAGRRKTPFIGELVTAEIVVQPTLSQVSETELTQFCRERLPDPMVPRFWTFLETIPVTENLKSKLT